MASSHQENRVTSFGDNAPASDWLFKLCTSTEVRNNIDAVFMAVHYAMWEKDFIPVGFQDCGSCTAMPENFRKSGHFKIEYYHKKFPKTVCNVIAIPMSPVILFHGTVVGIDTNHVLDLNAEKEICFEDNVSCIDSKKIYRNLSELLLHIKNDLTFPLFCDTCKHSGLEPRFTLDNLSSELKHKLLTYLPLSSLVSVSEVNKTFNHLANSNKLWKKLYAIGFPWDIPSSRGRRNWKALYKKSYIEKRKIVQKKRVLPQNHTSCTTPKRLACSHQENHVISLGDSTAAPDWLFKLCTSAKVRNNNDAVFVAVHYALLEMDFMPVGFFHPRLSFTTMPENFRKSGHFEVEYYHQNCPLSVCKISAVPVGPVILFHGTVLGIDVNHVLDLNPEEEICFENNVPCIDPRKIYRNLSELLLHIKNNFGFPLLCDTYKHSELEPRFTLGNLSSELKYKLLTYLPLSSLVSVSAVNKTFNELANSEELWKKLYAIDFPVSFPSSHEQQHDWKMLYKRAYITKNKKLTQKKLEFDFFQNYTFRMMRNRVCLIPNFPRM